MTQRLKETDLAETAPPLTDVPRPGNPTLARFLLDRLIEAGVDTVFGTPGDPGHPLTEEIDGQPGLHFRPRTRCAMPSTSAGSPLCRSTLGCRAIWGTARST